MQTRATLLRFNLASLVAVVLTVAAFGAPPADKLSMGELVTLSGEVTAVDVPGREVTLRGPLGGLVTGKVSTDVKNLDQVKVGDLVTIAYYQSTAVTAKRKGESKPIFTGSNSAAEKGELPGGYVATQTTETVTVISVDAEARSIVFQDDKGNITAANVKRPEFAAKLADLKPGDQLEVVTTEAYIVNVDRPTPGTKPSVSHNVTTLGRRQRRSGAAAQQHDLRAQRAGEDREGGGGPQVQVHAGRQGGDRLRPQAGREADADRVPRGRKRRVRGSLTQGGRESGPSAGWD